MDVPVRMEADFDFYDPLSKKAEALPLVDEVKHHRPGFDAVKAELLRPEPQSGSITPKTRQRNQVEIITKWGVMSGKLIFARVLLGDFLGADFLVPFYDVFLVLAQSSEPPKSHFQTRHDLLIISLILIIQWIFCF